jgi:hypothetical protein
LNKAIISSADSTVRRSSTKKLLALVSLAIVREDHPEWVTASVAARAREVSVSAEHISRLKAALTSQFEELIDRVSRRGRRPFRWRTSFA